MSTIFFEELGVVEPDYFLAVGSGSHATQTARVMERLEPVLMDEKPDVVLVPGDVNSTLAATLVAAKLQIAIGHVEAGLRSFDRTMPEEINRIVADEFSKYLFVHSESAIDNLRAEGIDHSRIHFVGNTMIDTLVAMEERLRGIRHAALLDLPVGEYLLVTLHRPALVDTPLMAAALRELQLLANELPVVFPMHPRTRARISHCDTGNIVLLDPIGYLEFLSLEADARAVLTDSGGVQEETTYLGVPCFTLRDNTERPITVDQGTNTLIGLDPGAIATLTTRISAVRSTAVVPPLWDGQASRRLVDALLQ